MKPIAIIGYSGRFPGADTLDEFWNNLATKQDCFERIPAERWSNLTGDYSKVSSGVELYGGFLNDIDQFDNVLFGISPKEVYAIDPHQRLFMEAVWGALEHGGYGNIKHNRSVNIGLYTANMWHDFSQLASRDGLDDSLWGIANRTSFFFDFSGPSVGIDTACSSALTCIHLACQSLEHDDCDMALAGAVNLILHPTRYIYLSRNKHLASGKKGLCFQSGQEGYIPSEGVGVLLLKKLDLAERDRDTIHGVIRGIGINHSGRGLFYKSPSSEKQADLVERVLHKAEIKPGEIGFVEMSAYGSETVDIIELMALYKVLKKEKDKTQFCAIGSLKPFLGHMEAASGIAQVIKTLLQFKHQMLLPSGIHPGLETTFKLAQTPFRIHHENSLWLDEGKRTAGVSCIGGGGSNAFMILEEYHHSPVEATGELIPILFSAASPGQLYQYLLAMRAYLLKKPQAPILDIGYTLWTGREAMPVRIGFLCRTTEDLLRFVQQNPDTLEMGKVYQVTGDNDGQLYHSVQHWCAGGDFSWLSEYGVARRIPLPGYPFQKNIFSFQHYNGETVEKIEDSFVLDTPEKITDYLLALFTRVCRPRDILSPASELQNIIIQFAFVKLLHEELQQQFGVLPKNIFSQAKTITDLSAFLTKIKNDGGI